MRLSQRADYAAHAMVEIARAYGERPVHATEIARRQGIPEPYLEQLLLALRRAALVRSYRGPGGGYTLTRPPAAISLADIVAALEGPFVPPAENYRLDLDSGGAATVTLDGKPQQVHSKKPASFNIDANGIQPTTFKGPNCP